jgi:hypothetical protein
MNEYKNPETMKSVIEYIEDDGDAVFREVFRNRLWVPIVMTAVFASSAVVQMFAGTEPVETTLDVAMSVILIGVVWWLRYAQAEVSASESKYAHALSYLDSLEDEPDA